MSQATIAPPTIKTLADLRKRLGGIPLDRIWFHPAPGTATKKDVIEAEARENRLCELVDGTLVEKAVGFEEARLATQLGHLVSSYVDQNDLGICVGADGMMRIAPGLVRIPDVSFITWDRLPGRQSPQEPIPDLAPDGRRSAQRGEYQGRDGSQSAGVFRGRRHNGLADRSQETDRPRLFHC
jgi:Putative restriction endonuclease